MRTRAELLAALDNAGRRDQPKIIYVVGTIRGNEASDGQLLSEQDYAPSYDVTRYLACFGDSGWSDQLHPWCGEQRRLRQTGSNNLKRQIEVSVPSNTTLVGVGRDAGFVQTNLMLHVAKDIVIRNLTVEAPLDDSEEAVDDLGARGMGQLAVVCDVSGWAVCQTLLAQRVSPSRRVPWLVTIEIQPWGDRHM